MLLFGVDSDLRFGLCDFLDIGGDSGDVLVGVSGKAVDDVEIYEVGEGGGDGLRLG